MRIVDDIIARYRAYLDCHVERVVTIGERRASHLQWPKAANGGFVMQSDTAIELGHPKMASVAVLLATSQKGVVRDGRITTLGEIEKQNDKRRAYGRLLLIEMEACDDDEIFPLYRSLERFRFELHLEGCMMRAASQLGREWIRVSNSAMEGGFSLALLGAQWLRLYRRHPKVRAAESFLAVDALEEISWMAKLHSDVERRLSALNKMAKELSMACDTCEFTEVCSQVKDLRNIHKRLIEEKNDG